MDPSPDPTIRLALQQLIIPPSFATTSDDGEQHIVQHDTWLQDASSALEGLQQYLTSQPTLSLEDDAQIVVGCAPFQVGRPWASAIASNVASNILQRYASPDVSLVRTILSNHVKPTFQGNPHPLVNMNTGRKLPTRLGGAMAQLDYLENQVWKEAVGVVDVISWCMSNMEASVYEQLWPFVVPPIMTLLDDHEVQYKLQGVLLTKILIARAPPELLRRTGVDGLIFSSMKKCMTFLHNPMTPALLRAVIPVSVTLIEAITPPGSAPRFSQLCEVLGDGIIGSVWSYSSTDPASIEATLETLPVMIEALGIAVARYLKALIPQLVHAFGTSPENTPSTYFRLLSVRCLVAVIEHCPERMTEWKDTILDGIARLWTALSDSGSGLEGKESQELEVALRHAVAVLARACPSLTTDALGFPVLLRADEQLFRPLLSDVPLANTLKRTSD